MTTDYLEKPFFPLGGLTPFEANSSTCLKTASSSANAARLEKSQNRLFKIIPGIGFGC